MTESHPFRETRKMLRRVLRFTAYCLTCAAVFAQRWRAHGFSSARVFARCRALNLWTRNLNRIAGHRVACPVCGWQGRAFYAYDCGRFLVRDVLCPGCGSQERHRLFSLYITRHDPHLLRSAGRLLHFAPEPHVTNLVGRNPALQTFCTDRAWPVARDAPRPAFQSDMQELPLPDNSVDAIVCLHVLEHVPDDRRAVRELSRVLKPEGVAYIVVPLLPSRSSTQEFTAADAAVFDHRREYAAADLHERLAPFRHEAIRARDFLTQEEEMRYSIPSDTQIVYRCTNATGGSPIS